MAFHCARPVSATERGDISVTKHLGISVTNVEISVTKHLGIRMTEHAGYRSA